MTSTSVLVACFATSATLRLVDWAMHRDHDQATRAVRLVDGPRRLPLHRRLESVTCIAPFIWPWVDLGAATFIVAGVAAGTDHRLLAALWACALGSFAATRFRFLQEVAHTALHGGLCRSRRWQWCLADVFANLPLFRGDSAHRFEVHVREHHRHVNELDGDPNIARFVEVGFIPGISRRRFRLFLVHPLRISGIVESLRTMARNAGRNRTANVALTRVLAVATVAGALFLTGGWFGLVAVYGIALLVFYPWMSWISLLVEHRWFAVSDAADRRSRECTFGRPTAYPGVVGYVVSRAVLPASDRHHLAHSLYPTLRWNHLPAVDRLLRSDETYRRYASVGLYLRRGAAPSALSDLVSRMTGPDAGTNWRRYLAAHDSSGRAAMPAGSAAP